MLILYIILALIAALILLVGIILLLPVKIRVEYQNDLRLSASLLGLALWEVPKRKRKVNLARYSKEAIAKRKRRLQKKRARLAEKKQQKGQVGNTVPRQDKQQASLVDDLQFILKQLSTILSRGVKHVRVEIRRFLISVATEDAAQTAILFGAVNQAAMALLAFLDQVDKLEQTRHSQIRVIADFASQKSKADIQIILTLRLWQIWDILWRTSLQYEEILFGPEPNYEYNSSTPSNSN